MRFKSNDGEEEEAKNKLKYVKCLLWGQSLHNVFGT